MTEGFKQTVFARGPLANLHVVTNTSVLRSVSASAAGAFHTLLLKTWIYQLHATPFQFSLILL